MPLPHEPVEIDPHDLRFGEDGLLSRVIRGWEWAYFRVDGTILTKLVHLSQTLNGSLLTLGIPF